MCVIFKVLIFLKTAVIIIIQYYERKYLCWKFHYIHFYADK